MGLLIHRDIFLYRAFRTLRHADRIDKAKFLGGEKLYISATPSENTVNFYMNNGAILAKESDKELYEMEPDDIHLEIQL